MYERDNETDTYLEPLRVRPGAWMWQGFVIGLAFVVGRMIGRSERGRVPGQLRR